MRRKTRLKPYYIYWLNGVKQTVLATNPQHAIRVANIQPNRIKDIDVISDRDSYHYLSNKWLIKPKE